MSGQRLTLDVIGQLEDELEVDKLNIKKWNKFILQVVSKDKEEQVRQVFNQYLNVFKFDGLKWCDYINYELNREEFDKAIALFQKCLLSELGVQSVDICRLYVSYVRRVNDVITGGEKARGVVIQAFEFALSKVGNDVISNPLWDDYLEFLKSWTPAASWEQQQKVDMIRKLYKKYLVIPTEKIEAVWAEYTKWENEVNPSTANKFISEKSAEFMLARSWNTEWRNATKGQLIRGIVAMGLQNGAVRNQLELWQNWIELERKNVLQLKEETVLKQRIEYVFKQATVALVFVPEVWFRFCSFLLQENEEANLSRVITLLKDGLVLNPKSLLLSFELAELLEGDSDFDKAKEVYENLLAALVTDYESLHSTQDDILSKAKLALSNGQGNTEIEDSADEKENDEFKPIPSFQFSEQEIKQLKDLEIDMGNLRNAITLTYSRYMTATKRVLGIKDARTVFKTARASFKTIGPSFFVENALMEHFSNYKKTAIKIFELALKLFPTDGDFLLAYLDYLINNDESDNLRKLIQTADSNIVKYIALTEEQISKPDITLYQKDKLEKDLKKRQHYLKTLYKKYITYALNYISLDVANSFTRKYQQLFPDEEPIELFSDRYSIGGQKIIKILDLGMTEDEQEPEHTLKRQKISEVTEKDMSLNQSNYNIDGLDIYNAANPDTQNNRVSFVSNNIYNLLRVLPNASYFGSQSEHVFNSLKVIELLSNLSDTK